MQIIMNQSKQPDGIVLLAKKNGPTSFSSLNAVKKALNTKKVGHTGTLDSFAQGLLVVCTGRLTKLAGNITEFDKEYEAVIKFGEETDTLEYTGNIIYRAPLPDEENLKNAVKKFLGTIMQKPPAFSAIHVNGKRASDLARDGQIADIPEREIKVFKAEIIEIKKNEKNLVEYCRINFSVSKGTYIRSLARDIAKECGSAGHLIGLYRKKVGNFYIEDAAGFSELKDFSINSAIEEKEKWQLLQKENQLEASYQKDKSNRDSGQKIDFKHERENLQKEIIEKKLNFSEECAELCGFEIIHLISKEAELAFKNGKALKSALFDIKLHELLNEKSAAVFTQDGLFTGLINKNSEGRVSYSFVLN
ncbi:MAG: tRNA pseudouridine(55) synthase TruB [Treponema sp.]|nr:tRNA pseudouridine(55) synthase TruB [Treponema sp.]